MAREYLDKLSHLVAALQLKNEFDPIEIKHFFSGAALYRNGSMRASWSPVGLAFKLATAEVEDLIRRGEAIPLKYFPKGHIKKEYALFENPDVSKQAFWRNYFLKALDGDGG